MKKQLKKLGWKLFLFLLPAIALLVLGAFIVIGAQLVIALIFGQQEAVEGTLHTMSPNVEVYRTYVAEQVDLVGLDSAYVDHILALMEEETRGEGTDVMGAGGFSSNIEYPRVRGAIVDPAYSIQCGISEFKDLLGLVGPEGPEDEVNLQIVYQAYHVGRDYIDYCNQYGCGKYTVENAGDYLKGHPSGDDRRATFAADVTRDVAAIGGEGSGGAFGWPLTSHTVSAGVGWYDPWGTGNYDYHTGTDFPAPEGTPIYASADGEVTVATYSSYGYGNHIMIQHTPRYQTLYGHCVSLAVEVGQYVHRGDVIGYVGSTGNSTGPHCHFEIRLDNTFLDPIPILEEGQEIADLTNSTDGQE